MDTHNQKPIDPLHRVFVHNGNQFRTHDGVYYQRGVSGDTIRRIHSKVRGKSARRADKKARRCRPS